MKKKILGILVTEDFGTDPHPDLDLLVRGTDPRILGSVTKSHGSGTLL